MASILKLKKRINSGIITLVIVVLFCLVLFSIYRLEGTNGPLHKFQAAFSQLSSPVKVVGGLSGVVGDAVSDSLVGMDPSGATVEELRRQNAELKQQNSELNEYKNSIASLENLLKVANTYNFDYVSASSIGSNLNPTTGLLSLNAGSNDGVSIGQAVMGQFGLIGQVLSVGTNTCEVRLISDAQSSISAMVQNSRVQGIASGSVFATIYLEHTPLQETINYGDVLITSGAGGTIPKGLLIGTVNNVEYSADKLSRIISVTPNGDSFGSIENVLIITGYSNMDENAANDILVNEDVFDIVANDSDENADTAKPQDETSDVREQSSSEGSAEESES